MLNLKKEILPASRKHTLFFRQHRFNASSTDILWDDALLGNTSQHLVGLFQGSSMQPLLRLFPRTGSLSRQQNQICMYICTELRSQWISSLFLSWPWFTSFKHSFFSPESFKYDIPIFFKIEVLAKLWDIWKWAGGKSHLTQNKPPLSSSALMQCLQSSARILLC